MIGRCIRVGRRSRASRASFGSTSILWLRARSRRPPNQDRRHDRTCLHKPRGGSRAGGHGRRAPEFLARDAGRPRRARTHRPGGRARDRQAARAHRRPPGAEAPDGNLSAPLELRRGDRITVGVDGRWGVDLPVLPDVIGKVLEPDHDVLIDDGLVRLRVERVEKGRAVCSVGRWPRRGLQGRESPGVQLPIPSLTTKDVDDLGFALDLRSISSPSPSSVLPPTSRSQAPHPEAGSRRTSSRRSRRPRPWRTSTRS